MLALLTEPRRDQITDRCEASWEIRAKPAGVRRKQNIADAPQFPKLERQ
jgi:hypothetical protein